MEICKILDRIDGLAFIGDWMTHEIYAGLNILLREDLMFGASRPWVMDYGQMKNCQCDGQVLSLECSGFLLENSHEVNMYAGDGTDPSKFHLSAYKCSRIPLIFNPEHMMPIQGNKQIALESLLRLDPSTYRQRPIPTILSIGLMTDLDRDRATTLMDKWHASASTSTLDTPFLWVNPNAAAYRSSSSYILTEDSNAIWRYSKDMGHEVRKRGSDVLDMWNMTIQASRPDGKWYGQHVAIVQAMMVINWLAHLETV